MDKVTEYQKRMTNVLGLARAACTEQERTELFAIAEAWSKLAIDREKQQKTHLRHK